MIAITTSRQFLGFTVGAGSGNLLEYSIHFDGLATRSVGRSGSSTASSVKSIGLSSSSGTLEFATSTEILQGPVSSESGSATVHTLTVANPSTAPVDLEVYMREDSSSDDALPPDEAYHRLWIMTLEPGAAFSYTAGGGAQILHDDARVGLLTGAANNVPVSITATTPGTAQTIHTPAAFERVTLRAGCTNAATVTLGIIVGGVEWQAYVSERTPIILLDDEPLGASQAIQVYASVTAVASVWGSRREARAL